MLFWRAIALAVRLLQCTGRSIVAVRVLQQTAASNHAVGPPNRWSFMAVAIL
jgi:hypothetical protein